MPLARFFDGLLAHRPKSAESMSLASATIIAATQGRSRRGARVGPSQIRRTGSTAVKNSHLSTISADRISRTGMTRRQTELLRQIPKIVKERRVLIRSTARAFKSDRIAIALAVSAVLSACPKPLDILALGSFDQHLDGGPIRLANVQEQRVGLPHEQQQSNHRDEAPRPMPPYVRSRRDRGRPLSGQDGSWYASCPG